MKVGDRFCIGIVLAYLYLILASDPNKNIYCHEIELESLYGDALLGSLEMFGLILLISPIYILGSIIFGNKKLLAEVTSRT